MNKVYYLLIILFIIASCNSETLPYLGITEIDIDTNKEIKHSVSSFSFVNQDSNTITEDYLKGKITIVDFFFSTCPTICPEMTKKMKEVQQKWLDEQTIQFLSHTVDPETDTPKKLKRYAKFFDIDTKNWNFVTGDQRSIYEMGVLSYLVPNAEDALAPGGFLHSDKFILIDPKSRIRGMYSGTDSTEVNQLILDIKKLKQE